MVQKVALPLVDWKTHSIMGTCFESLNNKTANRDLSCAVPKLQWASSSHSSFCQ